MESRRQRAKTIIQGQILSLICACIGLIISSTGVQGKNEISGASLVPSAASNEGSRRKLHFPADHGIGSLYFVPTTYKETRSLEATRRIAFAKGDMTVVVPPSRFLLLELNRYTFEHPDAVKEVTGKIDGVKAKFSSMDENEDGCDRIMPAVAHFKEAVFVDLDHSDVTDKGMDYLAGLPKLKVIHAFTCPITGACFEKLAQLPNLEAFGGGCHLIQSKNCAYIAKMPKLRELSLITSQVDDVALKFICQSPTIEDLNVCHNRHITDAGASSLRNLNHLAKLNISDTSISMKGLRLFKSTNAKVIVLPQRKYSDSEMTELKRLFPGVELHMASGSKVSDTNREIFAPLK